MSTDKSNTEVVKTDTGEVLEAPSGGVMEAVPVEQIVRRVNSIQRVMKEVMQDGVHYGKVPGTDKNTLLKPGAEVLGVTFELTPEFDKTRHDLSNGHREYELTCRLRHIPTGKIVGEGVGSASTLESKYRYRYSHRTCPECGEEAIIKGKEEYGGGWLCYKKKGGCGAKWDDGAEAIEGQQLGKVENPDIADVYNTILKMAKKRSHVDAILTATGASDMFTQDLEDMPQFGDMQKPIPNDSSGEKSSPATAQPAQRPQNGPKQAPNYQGRINHYRSAIYNAETAQEAADLTTEANREAQDWPEKPRQTLADQVEKANNARNDSIEQERDQPSEEEPQNEDSEFPPLELDDEMPFGKHQGTTMEDLCKTEADYINWLSENSDVNLSQEVLDMASGQDADQDEFDFDGDDELPF